MDDDSDENQGDPSYDAVFSDSNEKLTEANEI